MEYKELYKMASLAKENSYSPYSKFKVGAAILTEDGEVFTGSNVENGSYGGTICAERTACVKAVSEGYKSFKAIAIASSGGRAQMCGICRQFLSEFSLDMDVIVGKDEDNLDVTKLKNLLPDNFQL